VGYTTSEKVIRNDVRISCKPAPEYAPFSSVEDLDQYLRMSNDPMEGLWQYLDRNLDADRVRLGGNYRMATVADGQGGYLIIYLSGARYGQESWKPLRVKGRLHPTVFADHYDLEWLDSAGRVLERETNATVTTSGTILELHFPLEDSSLRFSRQDRRGE
ncbi:MAG: hypothetical protein K2F79_03585, partial [Muribaculaceae bacterium]|nr:hypothetical protein [Muribaculaceae bacterium]